MKRCFAAIGEVIVTSVGLMILCALVGPRTTAPYSARRGQGRPIARPDLMQCPLVCLLKPLIECSNS
jgi:hypothetical protein